LGNCWSYKISKIIVFFSHWGLGKRGCEDAPVVGENFNPKTSYWGKYKVCFGILKVFLPVK
jgi:hypothetical protein